MTPARKKIVAVIGAAKAEPAVEQLAFEVGKLLAESNCIVVTGGRSGVMEGASRGASSAAGIVVGILPGDSPAQANKFVQIPICTGMGEARNVIIAKTADAFIAIAGEYGTLSEIAIALKLRKRVISLNSWGKIDPAIQIANTAAEAVEMALAP